MKKTRKIRGDKADKRMDVGGEDGYPDRSLSGAEEEKVIDSFVRVRANVAEGMGKEEGINCWSKARQGIFL